MSGRIGSLFGLKRIKISKIFGSNVTIIENLRVTKKEDLDGLYENEKINKSNISRDDYKKYIGEIDLDENLVKRKLYSLEDSNIKELGYLFNERENDIDIFSAIEKDDKIVILGNPGLGKTKELEKLAFNLWYDDKFDYVPIYKNLKNFTSNDSISSYLAVEWGSIDKIIFIFDGIDEIKDIQNFTSKLETFVANLDSVNAEYKIIVSCRTNVYESVVKGIADFRLLYLRELTLMEGIKLLNQKSNFQIEDRDIDENYESFLKNPFLVDIISSYVKVNDRLPNNTSELWENYIDRRLQEDQDDKFKKLNINPPLIKSYSKKISLINELMKSNVFTEDDLFRLVNEDRQDYDEFLKNPLIDKQQGKPIWFFEHRNIQEYFAALFISKKEFKDILEFIVISNTSRTHPSLFNTITFLINLLDNKSEAYEDLVNWLVNNEPELLFRADFDRINTDIKEKVFQKYFHEECIEKTLWINTNRTYKIDEIAKFSDCKNNFDYLIEISENPKFHFRTRYSALEILVFFDIPKGDLDSLKNRLLEQTNNNDIESPIKAQIVRLISSKEALFSDKELIQEIFKAFNKETNKEINTALLSLLMGFEKIDEYSNYIKEEFLRANDLKKRDEKDDVGRGNGYKVEKLIIRFESPDDFLEVLKYYFTDHLNLHYNEDFAKQLLERCIHFSKKDDDFVIKLLSSFKESHRLDIHNKLLSRIIIDCNSKTKSVLYLLNNFEFNDIFVFASNFVDFTNVEQVVKVILDKKIKDQDIEDFRNAIGNNNHFDRSIAVFFDNLLRKEGVNFKLEVYTDEKREIRTQNHLKNIQNQINILFDKRELLREVKLVFDKFDDIVLTWDDISKIRNEWYIKNGHNLILINSPLDIIDYIMRNQNFKLKFDEAKKIINQETILFIELRKLIERYESSNWEFKLDQNQKDTIKKWCIETSKKIDFNNIIHLHRRGSFNFLNDNYKKIELIFYFQKLIGFDLDKEFLLNCIEFHHLNTSSEVDEGFESLKTKINDDRSFNDKIVENLINKELFAFSLSKHIEYALNHNLEAAFGSIREYLKEDDSVYNESKKIEKYVELSGDHDLLLECCLNPNSRLYWSSIKIMINLEINKEFCIEKSIEYIESDNETFKSYALENLIRLNHIRALEYIVEKAERKEVVHIRMIQYSNFDAFKDYEIIERLFNFIYNKEFDRFEYGDYNSFFRTYLSNLSVNEIKYIEIKELLNNIKNKLKDYGADLFYINLLIDDVTDSYHNSQANVLDFERAFRKMNELLE